MKARLALVLTALLPLSAACAGAGGSAVDGTRPGAQGLPPELAAVVTRPPLDQLHWGVLAVDASTGEVLADWGSHRKFVPASNMKILVTVAALARHGPDHRFRTALHGTAAPDPGTGVLDGDLVLVGSGDPTLSARWWPDDVAPLRALADSLKAGGVREVTGRLVVDATGADSTSVPGSWMVFNLPWYYGAASGAFAVAEGETEVVVGGADRPGVPATVRAHPRGERGFLVSDVRTVAADSADGSAELHVSWLPESRRLVVRGTVDAGAVDTLRLSTRDPVRQGAALLHRVLGEEGVTVRGGWEVRWEEPARPGAAPSALPLPAPETRALAEIASPPLVEIARGVLEPSQNWIAEQLVRALGASDSTRAGWETGLAKAERILMEEVGVDSLDLSLRDGSGLSAYDLVTPRALVRTLRWAGERPWGLAYREALAGPGEAESTLEERLVELEGRLQAKTGTISNVNSLSGLLVTDDGREVVFSILTNGSGLSSPTVRAGIDALVLALARGAGG